MKHLVFSLVICSLAPLLTASTLPAAPTELPGEIRRALDDRAHSLAAGETVEWDLVRTSPLTIAGGKKYATGKPVEIEQMLRGTVHAVFTRQADLRFFEHVIDEGGKPPNGTRSRTDDTEYSFDGTTRFTHLANTGESHGLVWATQEELRDITLDQVFLLDETYFRSFGISMSTTPKSIDKKLPPTSVILNLLQYGAQLSAVDHITSDQRNLVRLKIDATETLSPLGASGLIDIVPLGIYPEIASSYYYLDPQNNYEVVRSDHFDSSGFMVMQIECSDYQQIDPRPVRLPKKCVIQQFAPKRKGAIETQTITFKSFNTAPLPDTSFTLHDDKPGTYVIEHKATDHQKVFIVQKDGSLKPHRGAN